jgi:hypothetical protein
MLSWLVPTLWALAERDAEVSKHELCRHAKASDPGEEVSKRLSPGFIEECDKPYARDSRPR